MKILIVEDNSTDRELLMYLLEARFQQQAKFREASDLRSAFTYLERGDIDCIVLDLQLPDSEGRDTFLALHEKYPGLPIVVMTHNHDRELALDMIQNGAADYLIKNFTNEEEIFRRIVFAIERQRRGLALPHDKLFASRRLGPDADTKRPHAIPTIHVPEVGPRAKPPEPAPDSSPHGAATPSSVEIRVPTDPIIYDPNTAAAAAELADKIGERLNGTLELFESVPQREDLAARVLDVLASEINEGGEAEGTLKANMAAILGQQRALEARMNTLVARLDLALGLLLLTVIVAVVFLVLKTS